MAARMRLHVAVDAMLAYSIAACAWASVSAAGSGSEPGPKRTDWMPAPSSTCASVQPDMPVCCWNGAEHWQRRRINRADNRRVFRHFQR